MISVYGLSDKLKVSPATIRNRARKLGIHGVYKIIDGKITRVFNSNESFAIENCPKEKAGRKKKKTSTGGS